MKTKILILALMFVLLIPLYIAIDNLSTHEKREIKTSSIIVNISTTSGWSRVSFDGASIKNYKILDKTAGLKNPTIDGTGIIINKHKDDNAIETIRLELELGIFSETVELVIKKGYSGGTNVNIDGIGDYNNNKKPLQLPITIETTSDWTKVELNGATIRNFRVLEINGTTLRKPSITTNSIALAKLEANDTNYGSAKFLVDLSLDTNAPVITLEKGDSGVTKVTFAELTLENNRTVTKIFKNIPLTIETTSNQTEINFNGLYIRKAKLLEIDNLNLAESVSGSNFITLSYSHSGNSYRKASYLIDFGTMDTLANVTIMKNNPGYTVLNLAAYDFVRIGRGDNNSINIDPKYLISPTAKEPLFELDQLEEDVVQTLPLRIETTSDWTEVWLKDITITSAEIKTITSNIEKPNIGANNILIRKPAAYDNSFAAAEILLHINLDEKVIDQHKDTITMIISKGDIGATTVKTGKIENLINAEKIFNNDPFNKKIYEVPLNIIRTEKKSRNYIVSYNPVTYSVPLFNELDRQDIELIDTQEMRDTYPISADMLPGRNKIYFDLRKSEAAGLLSIVIMSYLILTILGIYTLSREGFFDPVIGSIGEGETSVQKINVFAMKLFEKTPASSLFILEALIVLTITPFLLLLNQKYAQGLAILAYFLLVFGVLLRLVGQNEKANRIFQWQDFSIVMFFIKTSSIVIILSSLVVAGYELMGLYGAIASFLPGLLFMFLVLRYLRKHFEKGSYATEW